MTTGSTGAGLRRALTKTDLNEERETMTRDYYCTGIPGARVEALLVEHDRLALIYTDAHCVQWREDVVKWEDVSPAEWTELVNDDGICPDGVEYLLDGMTREDLLEPMTG